MTRRILWIILGALSILAGVLAFANPLAATLTAERLAGWSFFVLGLLQVVAAFRQTGWRGRIWAVLAGLAFTVLGVMLLARPLEGVLSMTLIVGAVFMTAGVVKLAMSFSMARGRAFWMVLLSGVISVILSVMIFSNFPESAATILGVLLAIELISNGVSMIALSAAVAAIDKRMRAA